MSDRGRYWLIRFGWFGVAGIAVLMVYLGKSNIRWAFKVPSDWRLPLGDQISDFMDWLVNVADLGLFTFYELTRSISWLLEQPLNFASGVLATGLLSGEGSAAVQLTPPLSWVAVTLLAMALGHYARGWRLSLFVGACFCYLVVFGQWGSAMLTLSSILIAVPIGVTGGVLLGILAFRNRWMEKIISPLLDLMQTVPVFAYLVPVLFLFGFGPVAAMIATIIYAMPPMVRVTILALQQVPDDLIEAGQMAGCNTLQMIVKVLLPSSTPMLMVGVNQVIMLSLNMVIIASMIGAGGLGYDVLSALRRLDIGAGFESGLAIVVLAIALDRLSQAFATRSGEQPKSDKGLIGRHPHVAFPLGMLVVISLISLTVNQIQTWPESLTITTGDFWSNLVKHININYFDQIEAVKIFILMNVLLPIKRFLLVLPWAVV